MALKIHEFHEKIPDVRLKIAEKLGVVLPQIHISSQQHSSRENFSIKIKENTVLLGKTDSLDSVFFQVMEILEKHSHELINRQDVAKMVDNARVQDTIVVDELIPKKITLGQILKILQNLLKERIPIRDFVSILEILADNLITSYPIDIDFLTEKVRQGLARNIMENFFGQSKIAHVITLDPKVEQMLQASTQKSEKETHIFLRPITAEKIRKSLEELIQKAKKQGFKPVIVTAPSVRRTLKTLLEKKIPEISVFSFNEMASEIEMKPVGIISSEVLL